MKKRWLVCLLALSSVGAIYGQVCSPEGQLRLIRTTSIDLRNAGRVEICVDGVWGTIAANSPFTPWSEKNAQVACIELGFSGALNSILQHTIPFNERSNLRANLINVRCNGTEKNITNCPVSTFVPPDVDNTYEVYIVCRPNSSPYSDIHPPGPMSGDIRLFGDVRNGYGAVEIYSTIQSRWLGICPDSFWTNSDAVAVCQHLGYSGGSISNPVFALSNSSNRIPPRTLYAASCPAAGGTSFGVCSFRIGSQCSSVGGIFAAVQCTNATEGSVRLIGGSHSREGIVEIAYDGRWGVVCDREFSATDARSICQGLGFGTNDARMMSLSSSSDILENESNLKPLWLTEVTCTSTDQSLGSCIREDNIVGFADCLNFDIAAVDCGDPPGSSSGQTVGIVIGILSVIFVILVFGYIFGKDYWRRRHSYGWYNTITTPSSWCDSCCDCDFQSTSSWRSGATVTHVATVSSTGATHTTSNQPTATFNLTQHVPEPETEPEPEPGPEPSSPSLSKAPPPSYQASSNFPSHDPKSDLPPPYPGPGLAYPPPSAPAYPPAADSYPPNWSNPAYPPPAPSSSTGLPYPDSSTPYPDSSTPYPS